MHYVKYSFVRSEESPMDPKDAAEEPNPYLLQTDHSERNHRSFWQQHSSFGPNVNPEGKVVRLQQMKAVRESAGSRFSRAENPFVCIFNIVFQKSLFTLKILRRFQNLSKCKTIMHRLQENLCGTRVIFIDHTYKPYKVSSQ